MERFSCYWKNVRLKHPLLERLKKASKSFSCYWKNVRLKQPCNVGYPGKIPGFSCYWKNVRLKLRMATSMLISVMMFQLLLKECTIEASIRIPLFAISRCFSCYWKNVRLKPDYLPRSLGLYKVSVVIERMYDWSSKPESNQSNSHRFQLLLKECTIEAPKPTDWK